MLWVEMVHWSYSPVPVGRAQLTDKGSEDGGIPSISHLHGRAAVR